MMYTIMQLTFQTYYSSKLQLPFAAASFYFLTILCRHVKNASSIVTQSCGEMIEQLSSALCSLVIALIVDWSLALVVGSMTVALFIMLAIFGKVNNIMYHLN